MLRLFFILFLSFVAWHSAVQAEEPRKSYKVTRGQQFAVCRELAEILNQPENVGLRKGGVTEVAEYVIPKRYKNFKTLKWEPVLPEELAKYIYKEDTKQGFEKLKQRYAKIWDGKSDFIFEKTLVNFDNFGPEQAGKLLKKIEETSEGNNQETLDRLDRARKNAANTKERKIVLRYRLPNWKQWNCQLPDDMPEDYAYRFNMARVKRYLGSNISEQCQILLYQGKTFHTSRLLSSFIEVYEPTTRTGYDNGFGRLFDKEVCSISN